MHLATTITGQPTAAAPLLIAHGLFGSARNWGAIAKRLGLRRQVITLDMRNHGDSPAHARHGYADMAGDLAEAIAAHGGRADVLGHSMGGKAAMMLALTEPARVGRLIVADIAPAAYRHSQLPLVRAMEAVDLAAITRRSEGDAALARAVSEPGVRAFLLQSLAIEPEGARWKLALGTLAAEMPEIMGFPETGARFDGPTLFLTGGASDYVRAEHWPRIRALFPGAVHETLGGAGHWLHAEQPAAFIAAVEAFLDAT